jgi:hypothetical protein
VSIDQSVTKAVSRVNASIDSWDWLNVRFAQRYGWAIYGVRSIAEHYPNSA